MCINGVGGTILLLQNDKWIVSELKEEHSLGLMSWLNIILYLNILLEARAQCETDNASKVSTLWNTPEWIFITFAKDGCLA